MARQRKRKDEEGTTYWLSYSDMMAALLLTFVLIIAFTMLQSKKQYEEKELELQQQQSMLEDQQLVVFNQQGQLKEQQEILEQQEKELSSQEKQLSELVTQNKSKESELENQQIIVENQKKVMEEQQIRLDKLVGIRSDLVEALKREFDETDLRIQIDPQTGSIAFDSSIMFDYNDAQLKPSGKEFLMEFFPRYMNILLSKDFREYVSEVIIEGHTDTVGGYLFNLELSQRRALSVASFCLQDNTSVMGINTEELRKLVTANGRSFSNPKYDLNGEVDMEASRRVEFKFRLKDEEMITEMIEILSGGKQSEKEE